MGEFAFYIWSSYGIAFAVMMGLAASTALWLHSAKKRLRALEEATGRRRSSEMRTSRNGETHET